MVDSSAINPIPSGALEDRQALTMDGLRRLSGLTLKGVAQRLGVSAATVRGWEKGVAPRLSPQEMMLLGTIYQCSLDDLIQAFRNSMDPMARKKEMALDALSEHAKDVLEEMHEFKALCEPVLHVKARHPNNPSDWYTLGESIDKLNGLLVTGDWVETYGIGCWLSGAFAQVASNLSPLALKDAIESLWLLAAKVAEYEKHQEDVCKDLGITREVLRGWGWASELIDNA